MLETREEISKSEKRTIDSTTSKEPSAFSSAFQDENLVSMKSFDLYNPTEEHRLLRNMLKDFVREEVEPQALEYDRKEKFNIPLFRRLGDLGLLGITVPEAYGGSGMDALSAVIAHEELSFSDPGFCLAYLAHAMLLVNNLAVNGSSSQKMKFLPKLCTGEWIGGMAMTEPDVGTDVLGIQTTASLDKENPDYYLLNGRKIFITNGCLDENKTPAHLMLVYAQSLPQAQTATTQTSQTTQTTEATQIQIQTQTSQNLASAARPRRMISTFLVEASAPGYYVGQKFIDKTGMRASNTAELVFDNCRVHRSCLIGKEGDSALHMMRNLEIERLTLAAMSLGIAKRALDIMNRYAITRQSFGKPLHSFGQIQKHISESYAQYMASRAYVYDTARRLDLHREGGRIDSDGAKLVATTMGKEVADRAIQVLGGYGYMGEYVVERLWRDAKLLEIGGGTLEAHQKNMARDLAKNPDLVLN